MSSGFRITRRAFGKTALSGVATLGLGMGARPASAQAKAETIRIGWTRAGGAGGPAVRWLEKNNLLSKYVGPDINLTKKFVPLESGPVVNEGLLANELDIGMVGPFPAISMIARGADVQIICNGEGNNHHAVMVRPDSPIKDVADLVDRKSNIGTVIGSSGHLFVEMMFQAHFGKSPKELGVTLIDIPPASQATLPEGLDAVAPWSPTTFTMVQRKTGVILVDNNGRTGPAHRLGEGHILPDIKKSWGFPEGYMQHRTVFLARREFVKSKPHLVVAFLQAYQDSISYLHTHKKDHFESSIDDWKLPEDLATEVIKQDLIGGLRDWIWLTDGDLSSYVHISDWLAPRRMLSRPVSWELLREYTQPSEVVMAAYAKGAGAHGGSYPSDAEMLRTDVFDRRGVPSWQPDKWRTS
jgi:ABC-type nitrate/sulfonate/bicarbonate transport system substrate-binding protein